MLKCKSLIKILIQRLTKDCEIQKRNFRFVIGLRTISNYMLKVLFWKWRILKTIYKKQIRSNIIIKIEELEFLGC